ncbi:MAG: ketopantoate reductase family protein [Planctomycetota bacterium]|jgi:2-dehydropantoate 2-reductase
MRILIYGGGSVGLGIASCLLKSGAQVDIVARENTVRLLERHGLVRTGIFGDYHAEPTAFGSCTSLDEIQEETYGHILVCTKSFDSFAAAKDISGHSRLLGEETRIVLFQNGWGNAEVFSAFFERERIYNARVITGFRRANANEVRVTVHADAIHIGSLFSDNLSYVEGLCRAITKGDIPCEATDSIEKDLWAKMLYNCALNPLGAILNVPYGVLAEYEFARTIMNNIVEEVFAVMAATGFETHWPRPSDFLNVFYGKLVPDTAEHRSSTLQDILAKKRTEIDALNGAVIKLAREYETQTPHNVVVYNIVRFLEARASSEKP